MRKRRYHKKAEGWSWPRTRPVRGAGRRCTRAERRALKERQGELFDGLKG